MLRAHLIACSTPSPSSSFPRGPTVGMRVVSTESWAEGAQLWVSKAAGATDGRLYTTGSSTRLPVPRSKIVAAGYDNAAVGRVNIHL